MTVYGNFEAIKKIFTSHHGSIWSARAVGSAESPDCCVKVIELNATMVEEGDTAIAQHLLVAAALQQAMGNKSHYWAPIYGLGSQGTNGFYVSRLFPRSAQTLIEFKAKLTAADLKTLLIEVLEGLMDLDEGFHRSHGNLKPSNILLADKSKIRKNAILLCDPDASNEDVPSLTRTPDSKAIGELIYALVTHKPHVTARWPLTKSPHWKRLGSTGKQWFSLCDDLLNTVSRRGLPSLEWIRERVEGIHPTRRRMPRAIFALGLLGSVAAGAYVERAQLPGWYQLAHAKASSLIANITQPPKQAPQPTTVPSEPAPAIHPTIAVTPAPDPARVTAPPKPNVLPRPEPEVPVPPKPEVSVAPKPPAPVPASHVDDEGTTDVLNTPPPELHSEPAKKEFLARRDKFAHDYAGFGTATILSDWSRIFAKVLALETSYPPLDPASTVGWPTGLAGVLNGRRDDALVHTIDAAFDNKRMESDPFARCEQRIEKAMSATTSARDALARGDILVADKSIQAYHDALNSFPAQDADLVAMFAPINREFSVLTDIENSTDRSALFKLIDNETTPLAVRLAAWFHLPDAAGDAWPNDFAALSDDNSRADHLITLLQEAGNINTAAQITTTAGVRRGGFFSKLKNQDAVIAAVKNSNDPRYAAVLTKSPIWFRYDAALYALKSTATASITLEQKKLYTDLAAQVDAPNVQLVHDVLQQAQSALPPSLAESGPGSIKGWQLHAGWTKDHCIYVSPAGTDSLEFIHVHVPNDPDQIDCYLSTTEAPVALLRHLVNGNLTAFNSVETLNDSPVQPKTGMRLWKFDDTTGSVNLDDADYRKCFIVSPSEQLPMNFVTPQASFYLARRLGCRLPTSKEWLAAMVQAKNSTDVNMKGFATIGYRLRDRQFAKLLVNSNRDPHYLPDDNIFIGDTGREIVPRGVNAAIWQVPALEALSGRSTDAPGAALWPLSTLATSTGFGFRTVGDTDNYGGVFHDLIGNVAEYTMDSSVTLAEKVIVSPSQPSGETVRRVNDWFSADHLKTVRVIGGSALSPPNMDPTTPYPLPDATHPTVFADVGFRLAFTDPVSVPNAQRAVISEASYLTAP